jgi:Tfp pilus assembly protein PilO
MAWIVLVLSVLCIAMCVVALRYRGKWNKSEDKCRALERENRELSIGQRITISDNANMLANNINLQNELIALRGKYEQSEFQCDILRKESDDKSKRIVSLLDENNKLCSQLPKRDSKGRYCKK